jgi:exosortase/archaeosortase family protein
MTKEALREEKQSGGWGSLLGLSSRKRAPPEDEKKPPVREPPAPLYGKTPPSLERSPLFKAIFNPLWVKLLVIGGILFYLVTNFPDFKPFPEITAFLVAKLLGLFGIVAVSWGHLLVVDGLPGLEVSAECSGIILMMIFPLTIFLIPSVQLNHRLASLLFVPLLFFGNILRITADALIGLHYSVDMILFSHNTLGQVFIFFWAIGLYLIWLRLFNNFPREKLPIMSKTMWKNEDDA